MGTSIRLGKILGIPIGINYSWIFVFLLFIFLMAEQFGDTFPGWSLPQRWAVAVVTTVLFFLSVLAHELSHSVVAVHKGIPVRGITLFIFGGVSQLAHEARRPFTEFLVAIVGPLTSIILGLMLWGLYQLTRDMNSSLEAIFVSLSVVNLSLGVFNMLPGFPLDGGRVLRSAVWGLTGNYWRATQIAARAGQVLGGLMVVIGIGSAILQFGQFQGIWFALIGGFLFSAATVTYHQERVRESLRHYRVADVMTTDWYTLPGETPLASPLVAQGMGGRYDFVGVLINGRVQGIVNRRHLAQTPRSAWSYTSLSQVMSSLSTLPQVGPEEAIFDVVERIESDNLERLAVVGNGMLLGFISRAEARRFVRARRPTGFRI
jgi:Zn-dependent protease